MDENNQPGAAGCKNGQNGLVIFLNIQNELMIDVRNLLGHDWSVKKEDLSAYSSEIARAAKEVTKLRRTGLGPDGSLVLFPRLPYILDEDILISEKEKAALDRVENLSKEQDIVISIGIGGSYLGNQVLFDLHCGPFWNMMTKEERKGFPKVFFAGHNVDPTGLLALADQVKRESRHLGRKAKVLLLTISKSGTTLEPSTAIHGLTEELKDTAEMTIVGVTDREKGVLRALARDHHLPCFTVPDGIGGRFSELSQVGLVFAKLIGIDIRELLRGAKMVEEACRSENYKENPALLLAALKYIALKKYGIAAEIIMPYGDRLRSFGWWYAQLLGESLGKKYNNKGEKVYYGRIPVATVGTTDMHSLTQEHQQGAKNKLVQFISVENKARDISVKCSEKEVTGQVPMSFMLKTALRSNEEALASEGRMSCHISVREGTTFHLGALMYFFFLCITYEGYLADINAFDQPGVEDYKKILHQGIYEYICEHGK